MIMRCQSHLILLCRQPILGQGKSRLRYDGLSSSEIVHFQRRSIFLLMRRLGFDPRWQLNFAVTPDKLCFSKIMPPLFHGFPIYPQGHGNLGDRMRHLLYTLPQGPVIFIGSDLPDIYPEDIYSAFHALGNKKAVFAPSKDGGYWLAGLQRGARALPLGLFQDIRWSSEYSLEDTVRPFKKEEYILLDERCDIDRIDDYKIWHRSRGSRYI